MSNDQPIAVSDKEKLELLKKLNERVEEANRRLEDILASLKSIAQVE